MELHINGKPFYIGEKMEKAFAKAAQLSHDDICLEMYMKDDNDDNFDAIAFLNPETGESEVIYLSFLKKATNQPFFNFRALFLKSMIVNKSCFEVKQVDLPTLLSLDNNVDTSDIVLLPKDDILYVYVPSYNKPVERVSPPAETFRKEVLDYVPTSELRRNIASSMASGKVEQKPQTPISKPIVQPKPPIPDQKKVPEKSRENVFTKKLSVSEKRAATIKYLHKDEDSILVFAPLNKSIYRINKLDGEAKAFTVQSLIDNPLLGIDSADDILTLGIFDLSINKPFKFVSCCDIRTAFSHFKNVEVPVSGINYIVDEGVLYIVFASENIIAKGFSLKDFSIYTYRLTGQMWEQIEDKFESYDKKVFYIHRNNLPDCVAICDENTKTTEFKSLEEIASSLENFSLNMNTDLSACFPRDRIFDLNTYGTDNVNVIRVGSMKVIDACDIKEVRDSDECSTGYDKRNNMCFYCMPKF